MSKLPPESAGASHPLDAAPAKFDATSDLTASQQTTADLRFRLEQQSRILDITLSSISDFAYIFDHAGRFAFVNQALLQLWGLKLEEAVGKNFFDLKYPDELAARLQEQIQKVFKTGIVLTDETEYTSPTGIAGFYEYIFCPVLDREGKVEFVAGSTRDITERKRVEGELRRSQERLREMTSSLEHQIRARTRELEARNNEVVLHAELLRELSIRLMTTQDEERRHIAREMHDSAGQLIAVLSMHLAQISDKTGAGNAEISKHADAALELLKELDRELRTTSYLLHPPMLDELGLRAALAWYIEGLEQRSEIRVQLSIAEFERLSPEMEVTIFRVIQECLTNIHRHSGSKTANISVALGASGFVIEVRDFGGGIPAHKLETIRNRSVGIGLRGMRERVRPYSGDVRIDSQEGQGTTITITLPYNPAAKA
jgi:PAS domain S-box-containing protein